MKENLPLDFTQFCSTKPTAPYYSPIAEHLNTPVADLHMVREVASDGGMTFDKMAHAWKGCFLEPPP
eukprot:9886442-Prorocentrum_lima.AAC.1